MWNSIPTTNYVKHNLFNQSRSCFEHTALDGCLSLFCRRGPVSTLVGVQSAKWHLTTVTHRSTGLTEQRKIALAIIPRETDAYIPCLLCVYRSAHEVWRPIERRNCGCSAIWPAPFPSGLDWIVLLVICHTINRSHTHTWYGTTSTRWSWEYEIECLGLICNPGPTLARYDYYKIMSRLWRGSSLQPPSYFEKKSHTMDEVIWR